jgi:hypothetical protein
LVELVDDTLLTAIPFATSADCAVAFSLCADVDDTVEAWLFIPHGDPLFE